MTTLLWNNHQKHENSCIPDGVAEIVRDSKQLQAVEVYSNNASTISIASPVNGCEDAVETSGGDGYLQVLKDSWERESFSNARKSTGVERVGVDEACAVIEGTG